MKISCAFLACVLGSIFFVAPSCPQSIYPAKLEINLGPIPIDKYNALNVRPDAPGQAIIRNPYCSTSATVRDCLALILKNDPANPRANYQAQGVAGVRFMFALGGQFYSTAWVLKANGSYDHVSQAWKDNWTAFFTDLKSYGMTEVTPTAPLGGWGLRCDYSGCDCGSNCVNWSSVTSITSCGSTRNGVYVKWSPFPFDATSGYPFDQDNNDAYNCTDSNPDFWGWRPYLDAINAVLAAAQDAGVGIDSFDLQNEMNLFDFSVWARFIVDNTHDIDGHVIDGITWKEPTDVLQEVMTRMYNHGFGTLVNGVAVAPVTYSTQVALPSQSGFDCGTVYGDSAMLLMQSELIQAIDGTLHDGKFGKLTYDPQGRDYQHNLRCNGTLPADSPAMPFGHDQPKVVLLSGYVCVAGQCDLGTTDGGVTAKTLFNDVWSYLSWRELADSYVAFNETIPTFVNPQGVSAVAWPTWATAMVQGFGQSDLKTNAGQTKGIAFRPWLDLFNYGFPPIGGRDLFDVLPNWINPPYTP